MPPKLPVLNMRNG